MFHQFFDEDEQTKIKEILKLKMYIDFIREQCSTNPDIVNQYNEYIDNLSDVKHRQKQVQHADWKTMINPTAGKIFFEFRGFNSIMNEKLKVYPMHIMDRGTGSIVNTPVLKQ